METGTEVLLINPWIYDFAAYNLWIEPLGLLTLAAMLRQEGLGITLIDCLAPDGGAERTRLNGSSRFVKDPVERPRAVEFVPRRYCRYGISLERFEQALASAPFPDVVMVSSGMTYWYPGAVEVIRRVRERFGGVPVVLGGVYASLCTEHAEKVSGADCVVAGSDLAGAVRAVRGHLAATGSGGTQQTDDRQPGWDDPTRWPPAAHGLVRRPFAAIVTSWGCAFRCTYCASHRLQPRFARRPTSAVVDEIEGCHRRGIQHIAFYDDALLLGAERHLVPVLEGVLDRGIRVSFHTPNGVHASEIDSSLARLLMRSGFATLRLSLETTNADRQRATGGKITTEGFEHAVACLREAGFRGKQLGAYILAGLPGQPLTEVEATIDFAHRLGVQAKLALFSPIPGTPDGDAVLPEGADPLLHNNTVRPYMRGARYVAELDRLKLAAKRGNSRQQQE
jgi:radical SAM superfamily enzyme YgiQ (UPF0313 family)